MDRNGRPARFLLLGSASPFLVRGVTESLAARIAFVDLHTVLADGHGFLKGDVTSDGVHLNARGYMAVITKLKEVGLLEDRRSLR